jgi:hypothetical protein
MAVAMAGLLDVSSRGLEAQGDWGARGKTIIVVRRIRDVRIRIVVR